MGYVSLLLIPFLWLASLPLPDGDGWDVLRVLHGHARAFWVSPGMSEDQVARLLGDDWIRGCALVGRFPDHGNDFRERDYFVSGVHVIFEQHEGDIPRVAKVVSEPMLRVWWDVECYVAVDFLKGLPESVAEMGSKAASGWERVLFDIPAE